MLLLLYPDLVCHWRLPSLARERKVSALPEIAAKLASTRDDANDPFHRYAAVHHPADVDRQLPVA